MKRRIVMTVGLLVVAVVALVATGAGLWLMGCRPPVVGRWPSDNDLGPRVGLVGDHVVSIDGVVISVEYVRSLAVPDVESLIGPGQRCLAVHIRVQNLSNATVPAPESGTFAIKTSSGDRAYVLPVYTPDEAKVSPAAIGRNCTFDLYKAIAAPATDSLLMAMEPNAISDRAIEIPLITGGATEGKPEIIRTGRRANAPIPVEEASVGRPVPLVGCAHTVLSLRTASAPSSLGSQATLPHDVRIRVANRTSDILQIGEEQIRLEDVTGDQWGVFMQDNVGADEADEGYVYIQPNQTEEKTFSFELPAERRDCASSSCLAPAGRHARSTYRWDGRTETIQSACGVGGTWPRDSPSG